MPSDRPGAAPDVGARADREATGGARPRLAENAITQRFLARWARRPPTQLQELAGELKLPFMFGNRFLTRPAFLEAENGVEGRIKRLLAINGKRTVDSFHRELGKILWEGCGMGRNAKGLESALAKIPALREEFWRNLTVPGTNEEFNQSIEKAGRLADFFELAELLCLDARERDESCGAHFREEYQTEEGEALRDDEKFAHVAAWEYQGDGHRPARYTEPLTFEYVKPAQRSYK